MFLEKVYSGRNNWFLYVFSLIIIFAATQLGSIPLLIYIFCKNPEMLSSFAHPQSGDAIQNSTSMAISAATSTNLGLALTLLSFVVGFFSIFFVIKYLHGKKATDIVTGRNRVDWGRIFFGAGIWGGLTILAFAIQMIFSDNSNIVFQFEPVNFIVLVIISLLFFPFQTSFEELLFRGYLMQWCALLFKYRWVALVITGVVFGIMHSANPEVDAFGMWIAMPQYILMGLILGYVAIKDDGTELALGLHMANNILAAITFTSDASTLQTHALFKDLNPSASYMDTVTILISGIIFIWLCNRKYQFFGKISLWKKIGEQ